MKIRRFRQNVTQVRAPGSKMAAAPRQIRPAPPPRVWSLLLPPGYTNDRR